MARIIGTKRADQLEGTPQNDVIRGRAGDDHLFGSLGDDRLYGDAGNDTITDYTGRSELRGGTGDDTISLLDGYGYGGIGNDAIFVAGPGWGVGGKGDDTFEGRGAFWGDEGPGLTERVAGNDTFLLYADADGTRAHGGLGSDQFRIALDTEAPGVAVIDDFTVGADKLQVYAQPSDGESPFDLFGRFDANRNGVLEWSDSLSGGGVYVDDAANTMYLVQGAGLVIVHGATQITTSDWIFA